MLPDNNRIRFSAQIILNGELQHTSHIINSLRISSIYGFPYGNIQVFLFNLCAFHAGKYKGDLAFDIRLYTII